jgi:hypothetical protein
MITALYVSYMRLQFGMKIGYEHIFKLCMLQIETMAEEGLHGELEIDTGEKYVQLS